MQTNFPLKDFNTFGFEVFANKFFEYNSENRLIEFLQNNRKHPDRLLHIGRGSNLLFLGDFDGTILHSNIRYIEVERIEPNNAFVRAGAGVLWDDLCAEMVKSNFCGTENLSLIPGETGAAAIQNIGAYGAEIKDIIHKIETINTKTCQKRIFDVSECGYGYRESIFKTIYKGEYIITAVIFRFSTKKKLNLEYGTIRKHLKQVENPDIKDVRDAIIKIRTEKLPDTKVYGNAGSFFKNPCCCMAHFETLKKAYPTMPHYPVNEEVVKLSAAWLIEQCGWKGKRVGNVGTYPLQPLVLVNYGNAKPQEIAELSEAIQKSVFNEFSLKLECEVNFIPPQFRQEPRYC
ncbi:MAG: UDP-N-acetylmuramate dehydrogenase [Prevotellaceae bacterium]|jgi:UDP-N-acetylmuramate dehydrogenase|nr:UDP-N-acetylmuramate dehydrogenase [Prevotellaceae bacterium]